MKLKSIFLFVIILFFVGCKIDYTLGMGEGTQETYPDIVMRGVTQVDIQGSQVIMVEAEMAEIYNETGETRFEKVSFKELDQDNEEVRRGNAGEIHQYDNEDLLMRGQISVYDHAEDSSVEAEELFWDETAKTLKSPEDMDVSITLGKDGSLAGKGFSADLKTREISILSDVTGTMSDKEPE